MSGVLRLATVRALERNVPPELPCPHGQRARYCDHGCMLVYGRRSLTDLAPGWFVRASKRER